MTDAHPITARLLWIAAHTRDRDGKKWSMRSLSRAAGLTPSHLEQIKAGRIDSRNVAIDVLRGFARAGNVRTAWLMTGEEPREPYEGDEASPTAAAAAPERTVVLDARYPNLEATIEYWSRTQPGRWTEPAIAAARSRKLKATEDPTTTAWEEWLDSIEGAVAAADRGESIGTPVEDDFEPPIARRKKKI